MNVSFEVMTSLQYEVRHLRALVAAFKSGERYVEIEKRYEKALAEKDREIRQLKKELAAAHAETVDVRNKWLETFEDIEKETNAKLAAKDREVQKALSEMYQAQGERDDALSRLREKRLELYEVKTQLEEEKGKNLELTARVNRDYTNSSRSSSQKPEHKKILNNREKSGRQPGGQPGHPHHGRKKQEPAKTVEIPAPDKLAKNEEYRPDRENGEKAAGHTEGVSRSDRICHTGIYP